MEDLVARGTRMDLRFGGIYAGKRVLVTGHTGFKGGWLALWLHRLSAAVHGYALDPPANPSLFEVARIGACLTSDTRGDLADLKTLRETLAKVQPEVVFHLAAQPLVRMSYQDPRETMTTNVMGTVNVLEAARQTESVKAMVLITTDKVYENREWEFAYREVDPLGGHDPYSASKAAAEIVAASYRASFFTGPNGHPARIATARAGNVVGGGDWSPDRLVPDCFRAFEQQLAVSLRCPDSVRPWQHVLEPLAGYLQLAEKLLAPDGTAFARAWNFGPHTAGDASVGKVAETVARFWGGEARVRHSPSPENHHEAGLLRLDSTLARTVLGWQPRWSLDHTLAQTVAWHQAWMRGDDMTGASLAQIEAYQTSSVL